jgi:hypothetical protein
MHVDAILTNLSVAYKNALYIGDRIFPTVTVKKQSDKYFIYPKGAWFRDEAGLRAPGASAPKGGYELSSDSYFADEYAWDTPVPKESIENADLPLDPLQEGADFSTEKVLMKKERLVAGKVLAAGNWTTSGDVNALWAPPGSTNTFLPDILDAKETMRKLCGFYPNRLVMDAKTFRKLKEVEAILDRIKYTGTQGKPADVTLQTLAALLELEEVLIGAAIYSSAKEKKGGADFNAVDIWEVNATKGSAFLYYVPPRPSLKTPSAGYNFNWPSTELGTSQMVKQDAYRVIKKWWDNDRESWMIRASERVDAKVVAADCGCLFYDTIVT